MYPKALVLALTLTICLVDIEADDVYRTSLTRNRTCDSAGGQCVLKKKVNKECTGTVDKKYKCTEKKTVCCIPDAIQIMIHNLAIKLDNLTDTITNQEMQFENMQDHLTDVNSKLDNFTDVNSKLDNLTDTITNQEMQFENMQEHLTDVNSKLDNLTEAIYEMGCFLPWVIIGNAGCFQFVISQNNWDDARSHCQNIGRDLAVFDVSSKRVQMMNYLEQHNELNVNSYWVGGTVRSGSWQWITGEGVTAGWDHDGASQGHEPDANSGDSCVYTSRHRPYGGTDKLLYDFGCSHSFYFICEK